MIEGVAYEMCKTKIELAEYLYGQREHFISKMWLKNYLGCSYDTLKKYAVDLNALFSDYGWLIKSNGQKGIGMFRIET